MPGWGWLLIGAGIALVIVVVIWALRRKPADVDRKALADSAAKRLEEELAAEREARVKVMEAYQQLAEENKRITSWYTEHKERIAKEAQDDFQKLSTDPSALNAKLDELLGKG
jgi:sensor domain CHASE-containing protein